MRGPRFRRALCGRLEQVRVRLPSCPKIGSTHTCQGHRTRKRGTVAEFVRVETDPDHPAVAVIRLDRPKVNALNAAVTAQIAAAVRQVTEDTSVRAVVLYGGEKVFVAGADIKEMVDRTAVEMREYARDLQDAITAVARIPKPVVAGTTGYALGGGLVVAVAADLRGAGAKAGRVVADIQLGVIGVAEIQLGVIPGGGGTQRLPRLIGPARAKDMIFTGRRVKADEAHQIGLVDEVVADEEVYSAAVAKVAALAKGPTVALAAAK